MEQLINDIQGKYLTTKEKLDQKTELLA